MRGTRACGLSTHARVCCVATGRYLDGFYDARDAVDSPRALRAFFAEKIFRCDIVESLFGACVCVCVCVCVCDWSVLQRV